jgi:hypothetical protein
MVRATAPLAALLALIVALQGCSRSEPAPGAFTRVTGAPAGKTDADKLKAAEIACREETKRKGIASVVGILSRLRPGSSEEDYIACMKARGYEVKS